MPCLNAGARARSSLAIALALTLLAACSDRTTAPAANRQLSPPAATIERASQGKQGSATSTLAWEAQARELVRSHPTVSPIVAIRIYALLGMAQYGAVVAADERRGGAGNGEDQRGWGDDFNGGGRAQYEARRGAIAGASARVLSYLFPDAATALADRVKTDGEGQSGETHPLFSQGVETGNAMGDVMVAWASTDGFSTPWANPPYAPYLPGTTGRWFQASATVAPAGYQYPIIRPYYLTKQSQFRPGPPPAFGSAEFLAGLKVVRDISNTRTQQQTDIANFWNQSSGTPTTMGYWDALAGDLITSHRLDEREAAHILALINTAGMDAIIGCWEAKYTYVFLRPSMADPLITRPVGPPGFPYTLPNHPSYPSGHSCGSAAAATVLSHYFPEMTTELDRQVAEAGMSRVYGGIHYPFDIVAGQALGRSTAQWAIAYDSEHGLLTAVGRGQQ